MFFLTEAAHWILNLHALGSLPFVQQLIADGMLGLMEELLPESGTMQGALACTGHLKKCSALTYQVSAAAVGVLIGLNAAP